MIKWELKEKYDEQGTRFAAVIERYSKIMTEAGTHVNDLKAEQEAILRREFQTGEDLSSEKAVMREKIAEAEKAKTAAETEWRRVNDYSRAAQVADGISVRDLVVNWNGPYLAEVRAKELQPIVERMTAARDAYYNAVLDIYEIEATYKTTHKDVRQMELENKRPGDGIHVHELFSFSNLPQVNDDDLAFIKKNTALPAGIERIKIGGVK